jgi:hypothetical protein
MYPKSSFSGCLEPQPPLAGRYSQILHRSTLFTLIKTNFFTAIFNANYSDPILYSDADTIFFRESHELKLYQMSIWEKVTDSYLENKRNVLYFNPFGNQIFIQKEVGRKGNVVSGIRPEQTILLKNSVSSPEIPVKRKKTSFLCTPTLS